MTHKKNTKKIEYIIEYGNLPTGEHLFEFDIHHDFMQQYRTEPLNHQYNIHAHITLIKNNHNLQALVKLQGTIHITCDKCLKPYPYPISTKAHLLIEKGHPETSTNEILRVEELDNTINFSHYLYETIALALPYKIVPCNEFENVQCDEEILKKLDQNLSEQNKSTTFATLIESKLKP